MQLSNNWNAFKEEKENFVKNHGGGSHTEILLISISLMLLPLTSSCILNLCFEKISKTRIFRFVLESIIAVTLCISILTCFIPITHIIGLQVSLFATYAFLKRKYISINSGSLNYADDIRSKKSKCIQNYRSVLMFSSCITILAVDFNIFPRRFAKPEKFGTGLMDIGTGAFIFEHGFVQSILLAKKQISMEERFFIVSKRVISLLSIAVIKLMMTKATDYQIHVGEYGVHWNFFMTLAAVEFLRIFLPLKNKFLTPSVAIGMSVFYQYLLQYGDLINYLHSEDRSENVIDLNKEGIYSVIGYVILSILGTVIGNALHFTLSNSNSINKETKEAENICGNKRISLNAETRILMKIFIFSLSSYFMFIISTIVLQPVSRRSCNLSFVLWMVSLNSILLTVSLLSFCFLRLFQNSDEIYANFLLEKISSNMLVFFLFANILTGITNLTVETIRVSAFQAYYYLCEKLPYSSYTKISKFFYIHKYVKYKI